MRLQRRSVGTGGRWRVVALVAAVLLVGSLVPSPFRRRPMFETVGPDKLLHLLGHAGLAAALADALAAGRPSDRVAAVLAVGVSTGYGLLTGRLQRLVPGRESEHADHVAGLIGAVIGVVCWRRSAPASGSSRWF